MNPGSFGEITKSFTLPEDQVPIFEEYVNLTSKPINRPYYQTFKMVENWQTHAIIRRYNQCTKDKAGDIPGDVLWWYLRKEKPKRN